MRLKKIGENELLESSFVDAELYLIKVLQSNSPSTTFVELRYELYRKKKKKLFMTSHLHHDLSKDIWNNVIIW